MSVSDLLRPRHLSLLLLPVLQQPAGALFIQPELRDVPLARLVENVEAKVDKNPDDAEAHHHLARVHAMAYSKNLAADDKVKMVKRGAEETLWFGHVPPHVPYAGRRVGAGDVPDKKDSTALGHLERAIAAYEKSLSLEPKNPLVVRMGLAWCRKEAGDKEKAIEAFRAVIEDAWEKDGKAQFGGLGNFVSAEAIGYLLPLLDAKDDAAEIADLEARQKKLAALPRPVTPIAIPLRDGLGSAEMIDADARVAFDLDGSGERERQWQWLRPGNAAWLVHDPRRTGMITSGIQMFGNRSFHLFLEHGYQALELLDDNADGFLRGDELDGLALWHDHDSDGVSSAGEVQPLEAYEIGGLSWHSTVDTDGVRKSFGGVLFRDGTTRASYDLVMDSYGAGSE